MTVKEGTKTKVTMNSYKGPMVARDYLIWRGRHIMSLERWAELSPSPNMMVITWSLESCRFRVSYHRFTTYMFLVFFKIFFLLYSTSSIPRSADP